LQRLLKTEAGKVGDKISDSGVNEVATVEKSPGVRCQQ
jgi:hypothetical protein